MIIVEDTAANSASSTGFTSYSTTSSPYYLNTTATFE